MRLITAGYSFLGHLPYSTMLDIVCKASSLCYGASIPSGQKEREAVIRQRIKKGHETVIEHVGFSVLFSVDRGVTHEMVRHRLSAFTQESTRYCNYSDIEKYQGHVAFVMPSFVKALFTDVYEIIINFISYKDKTVIFHDGQGKEHVFEIPEHGNISPAIVWLISQFQTEQNYKGLLQAGASPQMARGVLTNAVKAQIAWTANMREWRHIFNLRAKATTGAPHPQMLEVMSPLLEMAKQRFPIFFEDL